MDDHSADTSGEGAKAGGGAEHACDAAQGIGHIPVLAGEVLEHLGPWPGDVVIDGTAGRGGHAMLMAERMQGAGTLALNDADAGNLTFAQARVTAAHAGLDTRAWHGNFVEVPRRCEEGGLAADVFLADLGFASNQMDTPERGLSFRFDAPLDMRFDREHQRTTAADLLRSIPEQELVQILREYGEERSARRIAAKIVEIRAESPIETTGALVRAVVSVLGPPGGERRIHPATRTFQALRIAVNDELGCLRSLLESVRRGAEAASGSGVRRSGWLAPGSRVGIIAFHSLEDRMVKRAFAELVRRGLCSHVTRKPVESSDEEVGRNPRSRSAKLRVLRIGRDA